MDLNRDVYIKKFKSINSDIRLINDQNYVRILLLKSGTGLIKIGLFKVYLHKNIGLYLPSGFRIKTYNSIGSGYLIRSKEEIISSLTNNHFHNSVLHSVDFHHFDISSVLADIDIIFDLMVINRERKIISIYLETIVKLIISQLVGVNNYRTSKITFDFINLVINTINENQNLEKLVHILNISKSKLYKHCKNDCCKSPKEIVSEIKFLKSSSDLISTDLSCTEIAHKYGFHDSSHFTKFFKNKSSVSPKDYRELYDGNNN